MEIIKITDDCGHDRGYYNVSTDNGKECAILSVMTALHDYDEECLVEQLTNHFKMNSWNTSTVKEYLEDTMIYIEEVEIIG